MDKVIGLMAAVNNYQTQKRAAQVKVDLQQKEAKRVAIMRLKELGHSHANTNYRTTQEWHNTIIGHAETTEALVIMRRNIEALAREISEHERSYVLPDLGATAGDVIRRELAKL
jgi:glucose-6-phosphate-specific signal transduction histidine kinase